MHTTGTVYDGTLLRYRASKFDCDVCPLKLKCCPNTSARHVPRDLQEDARDLARRLMGTKRFLKSRDERKRVEDFPAHATSSISPPSCRTSKRWRCEPSNLQTRHGPPRLRQLRCQPDWSGQKSHTRSHLNQVDPKGRSFRKDRLFRQHGHSRRFGRFGLMSVIPPIASGKRTMSATCQTATCSSDRQP